MELIENTSCPAKKQVLIQRIQWKNNTVIVLGMQG